MKQPVRWVRCKGCGRAVGFVLESFDVGGWTFPEGAVFHSKPLTDTDRKPVDCPLYQGLGAREFAQFHTTSAAIEGPVIRAFRD